VLDTKSDLPISTNVDVSFHALVCRQVLFSLEDITTPLPHAITNILQEFKDVFPTEIPPGLPPLRGIEHQIDLISGASLPNRAMYRPIQRQRRKFSDKSKNYWTMGMYVRALVIVLFLLFWFLRKMVLGTCVFIVKP
jgi:hypothetical protein